LQEKPAPVEVKPKKAKEPTSFALTNPSRLIPTQARFVSLQEGQRYVPICRQTRPAGIVMLFDTDPSAPEAVEKGTCIHTFSLLTMPFLVHTLWLM
jgi:hypothetical protein